ncbi:MAG: 5-oxoprolinase subunit PxpA [Halothiobacillaceae bacterium]
MRILLNADVGEGFGNYRLCDEAVLMPLIDQANVACGFHAGDPVVMRQSVLLALTHGVRIGAHPGYPDLQGFGRRSLAVSPGELVAQVRYQVGALEGIVRAEGGRLDYVKPHGALYHDILRHPERFEAMLEALAALAFDHPLGLMVMAGPAGEALDRARAEALGVPLLFEAFADRAYGADGRLTPRDQPGACLDDAEAVVRQVRALVRGEPLPGLGRPVRADSLCLHGDHPRSATLAQAVRAALEPG